MNYEFYADVFFVTNFYLDFLAVYAVSEVLQQKKRIARYLLGCAISSFLGCILFLQLGNYDLYLLCVHFIVNPGMVWFCFFPAGKRIYGKAFCLMYFVILLLGGSLQWMYGTVTKGHCYELCLLLMVVPVMVFLFIIRKKRRIVPRFYEAEIVQQGRKVRVRALYDTGNSLTDPYIGKPVHVIAADVFEKLGGKKENSVRLVPFSSVGCESGMLEAFTVELLRVESPNGEIEIAGAVLAAAEERVFRGRDYQMILNSNVGEKIERKEEKTCT